jgi:hypothetical protein
MVWQCQIWGWTQRLMVRMENLGDEIWIVDDDDEVEGVLGV